MKKIKKRLDTLVQELNPTLSKTTIQSLIMQGKVKVDDKVVTKAGIQVAADAVIGLTLEAEQFVCRAGYKLEKALNYFAIDVTALVVLDAGLSTGGFTDCLIQRGAAKVYGVDVGYGQVHEKIRQQEKVMVLERTNLRYLDQLPELVDLVTLDLSFISVLKVMDAVTKLLKPTGQLIVLIKPQFEAGKQDVGKGGIITDPTVHERVIKEVVAGIVAHGFSNKGVTESPILGGQGNKEFLAYFVRN